MAGLGTFRRIVITANNVAEIESDINRLFGTANFKSDFKELKTTIKKGVKPNVLVIDLSGEGADSVARKVKDSAIKFKASDVKIKNEKPMGNVKENKNMNKTVLRKLIKEEIETVQKEQGELETGSTTSEAAKPRKLEKDEIGKFYVVTQPAKLKDNCVHELNMLELASKIKSGEIDEAKIMGVYSSKGHANSHSKDLLGEIEEEMNELKTTMDEYRKFKNQGGDLKNKAMNIITKYKK